MGVKVIVPPVVVEQIYLIGLYTAQDDHAAAIKLIDSLEDRCESLNLLPERGALYGNYRRLFEGKYQIIYQIHDTDDVRKVVILSVHHMSRHNPEFP
jgi:plasmid stabilization system protein ParE